MTHRGLNIGDVFRVAGGKQLWRKVSAREARQVLAGGGNGFVPRALSEFGRRELAVVKRTAEIGRAADMLVLKGGEVTLQFAGAWRVHACTPGAPLTTFVLAAGSLGASTVAVPTERAAVAFAVRTGAAHLGRERGSLVFAYGGRVYARATNEEALGAAKPGGYGQVRRIDGARRLVIAGVLGLPGESALYDIIMEHFGPDTVARPAE